MKSFHCMKTPRAITARNANILRLKNRINSYTSYNNRKFYQNLGKTPSAVANDNQSDDDSKEEFPEWYQTLLENAEHDEELRELIDAAQNRPEEVQAKMRAEMDSLHSRITGSSGTSGEGAPPEILIRQIDPFELWVWVELYSPPSSSELEMVQEVVNSWFMLGRLGAFNSANLQILYSGTDELEYEQPTGGELASTMHDMCAVESNGPWLRFWVDMGTSDELALDILINALITFSKEHVGVRQVLIGGQNDDWELPEKAFPETTMDPMQFTREF